MVLPTATLPPKKTESKGTPITLQQIVGNLELLYVKAKNFHWNVTGPNFRSLHLTFDGVQEVALEWADTIAERARALDMKVDARSCKFLKDAWFPEVEQSGMNDKAMINDMVLTLTCICDHLCAAIGAHTFDPVTENQLQELSFNIDRQLYFVKSNIVDLS